MKKLVLLWVFLLSASGIFSQEVELFYQEKSLNSLIIEVCEKYRLQYSFDEHFLSQFKITVAQKFPSPEEAFLFMLKDLPVDFKKTGEVYLFLEKKEKVQPPPKNYLLSGQFTDQNTGETLPYTHLSLNGIGLITDQKGNFSYLSKEPFVNLQASYLGYFQLDTFILAETNKKFTLGPAEYKIGEIEVKGLKVARSLQVGDKAGELRLNHQVSRYLPGTGDNSVFTLLRLQPGILAAGEQSNDLVIWGSYEGQSQVIFDGFTLFGMKNFNDNISAVNPFMAKDIRVMKGAYGAEYGGRVGGLALITGIDGDTQKNHLNLSLNNMTINGMLTIPVAQQSALIAAFRQTYYELYDSQQLSFQSGRGANRASQTERILYPDYNFRDFNLKYSGTNQSGGAYSISALCGEDRFSNTLENENEGSRVAYEDHEHNKQYAASAFYQQNWKNGNRSKLSAAYSSLEKEVQNLRQVGRRQGGHGNGGQGGYNNVVNQNRFILNGIAEAKLSLEHRLPLDEKQQLDIGAEFVFNEVNFREDSFLVNLTNRQFDGSRINIYLQDAISPLSGIEIKLGLRGNYSFNLSKFYLQPRVSSSVVLGEGFKLNAAWGLHNQFITRSSLIDEDGNYHYLWAVCDNQSVPVLEARHWVTGFSYNRNNFTFSVEGFDKKTKGMTRYMENLQVQNLFEGESKAHGLDFFIKQEFKGHSAWISYTLSETLERFDYFSQPDFWRALHDQRHEVKTAVLLNFNPFHFSANYVFGSGFPDPRLIADGDFERNYHRMDVSATYTLSARKFTLEGGFSILNVFDYTNLKYANFVVLPDDQDVSVNLHAEAIPFTPTVFVNFSF